MIRKAFLMRVNPDQHEEYRQRHNPIWPELEATLKSHALLHMTTRSISIPQQGRRFGVCRDRERSTVAEHRSNRGLPASGGTHARDHALEP